MSRKKSNPLRRRKASVARGTQLRRLPKAATGIQGLDEVTGGGLPRGRTTPTRRVTLPDGWLDDPNEMVVPLGAELAHSGG